MKSLKPDDVRALVTKISNHIKEKAKKISMSVTKLLRGIISELGRLLKIAKRKLKKMPSLAETYRIHLPMHHEYQLSRHKLL